LMYQRQHIRILIFAIQKNGLNLDFQQKTSNEQNSTRHASAGDFLADFPCAEHPEQSGQ
jgi:hypothetical protein